MLYIYYNAWIAHKHKLAIIKLTFITAEVVYEQIKQTLNNINKKWRQAK